MIRVDAAIIGGQKCGTTTLFHALARHPGVNAARAKESRAFLLPPRPRQAALNSLFDDQDGLTLHAYAHAWSKPAAIHAMWEHNPAMRLIALTRPPVERVWSAYQFARRNGWESLPLGDALAAEASRSTGDHIEATELQYVANSRYDALIQNVAKVFPAEQLLVLSLDALADADTHALAPILSHLGLADANLSPLPRKNTASTTRIGALHRMALAESLPKRVARTLLPPRLKGAIHQHITHRLLRWNTVQTPPKPLPSEDRALIEHYLAEAV